MPQVTKEQVSLRQKDRKKSPQSTFPLQAVGGLPQSAKLFQGWVSVTVALPWSFSIRDPSSLLMLPWATEDRMAPSDP